MKKALFLDRDGVINTDKGHVHLEKDFFFEDGIFKLCRRAISRGFKIIVITNQAGIAKGFYQEACFNKLTYWMVNYFETERVKITKVYHCPHHENYTGKCSCRKPEPGMIIRAQKDYNIDLKKSFFIGDKKTDMQAAENAGINNRVLYLQNKGSDNQFGHETIIISKLNDLKLD